MKPSGAAYQFETTPLPGTHRVFAGTRSGDQKRVVVKRVSGPYSKAEEVAVLRHELSILKRLEGAPVVRGLDIDGDGDPASRPRGRQTLEYHVDFDQIRHILDTNITGMLSLIQNAARQMMALGRGAFGSRDPSPDSCPVPTRPSRTRPSRFSTPSPSHCELSPGLRCDGHRKPVDRALNGPRVGHVR